MKNTLISHQADDSNDSYDSCLSKIQSQIIEKHSKDELEKLSVLLDQLTEFEFGRFLIEHQGLNGHWTHEIVTWNPDQPTRSFINTLEQSLFENIPATLATRQRFHIFQNHIRSLLKTKQVFASIPSGYMSELLLIDAQEINQAQLFGVDLDHHAIEGAKKLAKKRNLEKNLTLIQDDAWSITFENKFDVITSNGLNIYEHDDDRVKQLYQNFYRALTPNGTLITSFLTPAPTMSATSPWNLNKIDMNALNLQKDIFVDILQAKWSAYRDIDLTMSQLKAVGFRYIEIIYDDACVFPTVIAQK